MVSEAFRLEFQACREPLLARLAETPARIQTLGRAGMEAMHWRDFLLHGPPGAG